MKTQRQVQPARTNRCEADDMVVYFTPSWLVERIRALLGGIDLDPCTEIDNPCKADRFYTRQDDGLLLPWDAQRIFVNPPYGRTIAHWWRRAAFVAAQGRQVVFLCHNRTESSWFQEALKQGDDILFFAGRIRFGKNHGTDGVRITKNQPASGNALIGLNVDLTHLRDLGTVVSRGR